MRCQPHIIINQLDVRCKTVSAGQVLDFGKKERRCVLALNAKAVCFFNRFINRLVAVEFSASGKMAKFGNNIFKNATKLQSIELPSKIQHYLKDRYKLNKK